MAEKWELLWAIFGFFLVWASRPAPRIPPCLYVVGCWWVVSRRVLMFRHHASLQKLPIPHIVVFLLLFTTPPIM